MKRKILALILVATCAISLVACGSSSSSSSGSTETTATATEAAAETEAEAKAAVEPSGEVVTLKYDLQVSMEHPWGIAAQHFKDLLEEKSNGQFQVEIYPSSTSGSEQDSVAGILVGTTDIAMTGDSFSTYANTPSATLLAAPWCYNSEDDVKKMLESDIGKGIMDDFEKAGYHVMWYQLRGARQLTSNVPICTPEDLKGLRLRMSGNALHTNMWTDAGAICSSIALGETFNALNQGVVDMQENPYDMIFDYSVFEVQKYTNETAHVNGCILNVISADLYNNLSDDMRECLDEAIEEMQDWTNDFYYEHRDDYRNLCEEAGMIINTDVDRDAFKEIMTPAIKDYLEETGDGLWELYQEIEQMSNS